MSALDTQVGGDHYKKLKIQPVEYMHANGIPFIEGCIIKYASRWRDKGGIADLEKIKHFAQLLIDLELKAQEPEVAEQPSHIISDIWKDAPVDATHYTHENEYNHSAYWKQADGLFVGCWVEGDYYPGNGTPDPDRLQSRPTSTAK